MHPSRAWAEVDLDALAHNLAVIRERVGGDVRTMLVVKADAYGHGAVPVARHAVAHGVDALGVGTCAEALELREAGLTTPILVLGTIVDEEVEDALRGDVDLGLHSTDRQQMLQRTAKALGVRARVHLNVDTGMGRLGVLPGRALELLRRISSSSHLELAGIMTHVAAHEGLLARETTGQLRAFDDVLRQARAEGLAAGWTHVGNSACLFSGLPRRYDAVRPGTAAFGVSPQALPGTGELRAVLSFRTQVVFMKDLPKGAPVGYDSTWRAPRPTRIATLPVGYDDGVPWRLSNAGSVLVRGVRAPIVGRVSMDYTTIDVTDIPDVGVGDLATVVGRDGGDEISAVDVARIAGTIPYEITCSLGKRVQRLYPPWEGAAPPLGRPSTAPGEAPRAPFGDREPESPENSPAPPADTVSRGDSRR